MAVDPESPTASFRDSLDEQPTAPRRNSIEDQDPSRPRKRLATMGSVTPQSDSPTTERGEDMEHSFVDQSAQPNFVQVIEDDIMEQSPESRAPQGSVNTTPVTDQESPASSTTLNKITVNLRPMKSAKGKNIHLTNGIGKAKSLEDVQDVQDVEEVQDEEDDAGIQTSSEATSSPASTQDTSLQSNADVEVEELDDMEEDDISPDEIRIIGGRSPGHILNHQETLNEAKNALNTGKHSIASSH